ncbi:MAG: tetratricopeptide repeat protein [Calothrix sp. MO_167.B12]|nr:tetratricopeptide repeat protein [Calothrix sp. MO_167.B12]
MSLELTDWDKDLPPEPEEEYQAFVRTLLWTDGFGLLFVRCSPREGEDLINKVQGEVREKNIQVLRLQEPVNNLYERIEQLENRDKIDILFITGLESSFYAYEECKRLADWQSKDVYSYSWKSVPPVLMNLNQQRERFKDNFNICFVFLLPLFGIKYFIQRAPDFFDWRSGSFEFPTDLETLEQESSRVVQEGSYEKYLSWTPEARTKEIINIQELIAQEYQTPNRKAELFFELGRLSHADEDYIAAIASYDKAVAIKPDFQDAWNNRGNALGNLGRYEQAIASYDKAFAIKPDFQDAWYNRGIALENLGRYEQAVASYDKAVAIKPDFQDAWNNRGIALFNLGRNEQAISSYDKAVAIKPDKHEAWYNRACAYSCLGDIDTAIENLQTAVNLNPKYQEMAKTDSDFDAIRDDERFVALMQEL